MDSQHQRDDIDEVLEIRTDNRDAVQRRLEVDYLRAMFADVGHTGDIQLREWLLKPDELEVFGDVVEAMHAVDASGHVWEWFAVDAHMRAAGRERRADELMMLLEPPTASVVGTALALRKLALERRRIRALTHATRQVRMGKPVEPDDVAAELRAHEIERKQQTRFEAREVMHSAATEFIRLADGRSGNNRVRTGYSDLDSVTGGLDRGAMMIVGGRPSDGKSTVALGIAMNRADAGERTSIISVEDPMSIWGQRYLSKRANISAEKLRLGAAPTKEDMTAIDYAWRNEHGGWFLHTLPGPIGDVLRAMEHAAGRDGCSCVIIDYAQRIKMKAQDRRNEVREVVGAAKAKAQSLGIGLIFLAQTKRLDSEPQLSDLKEAGDLEEMAEQVLLLWRIDRGDVQERYAKLAKNKTGRLNVWFRVEWDEHTASIRDLTPSSRPSQQADQGKQKGAW